MTKKKKQYVLTWTYESASFPDCNETRIIGFYDKLAEAQVAMFDKAYKDLTEFKAYDEDSIDIGRSYKAMAEFAKGHDISFDASAKEVKIHDKDFTRTTKIGDGKKLAKSPKYMVVSYEFQKGDECMASDSCIEVHQDRLFTSKEDAKAWIVEQKWDELDGLRRNDRKKFVDTLVDSDDELVMTYIKNEDGFDIFWIWHWLIVEVTI